ncbi:MAG: aldo/keto reductase [Rhodoferax sp.]|nr:aldo/keto reductase [Rhodoferax sp.]
MQTRNIAGRTVPAIGLGCMNLNHAYGNPPSAEEGERLLLTAFDAGVRLFDTAALYGFGRNEELVGRVLKTRRQDILLCSKGGMAPVQFPDGLKRVIDGRPEAIRRNCEDSLRRLGTDVIDLYYLHRWQKTVPIEDSVGALADLVRAGKVRTIGLSEVSAVTLRKAHAVHPIAAVQSEYSLWTRNAEIAVLQACADIGATYVAFSPVARGFLCGQPIDGSTLPASDLRSTMPRFLGEHLAANLRMQAAYNAIARDVGCTPAQLAIAWLLHKAPHIIPLPGTGKVDHLLEDLGAADVVLDSATMARLEATVNQRTVSGPRYAAQATAEVDTETF